MWLHSSVGRASHRHRGGHGFEFRWSLDFFRLLLSNCLNWKIYCDDHSSLWSTTAVQIYVLFHIYIYHIKKLKWCEFCHYRLPVVFSFLKQFTNLINYSFWMMTMSSFRLKTFFTRSFQHSVSILTNILAFFLQHLLKIRTAQVHGKHINKRKPHNNKFIAIKVHVSRFPVVSNKAVQELNSVPGNKNT